MWVIRVLTGPLAGKAFKLKHGTNVLGRASSCDVSLAHSGISKEHAKLDILDGKLILTDLNSRNGTFVNGIKIKSQRLNEGDKIGLYNMICDLKKQPQTALAPRSASPSAQNPQGHQGPQPIYLQQEAVQLQHLYSPASMESPDLMSSAHMSQEPHPSAPPDDMNLSGNQLSDFPKLAKKYFEQVALPGVYRLAEVMEFRSVLMLFMAAFILFVTSLSSIPLMRILKASVEQESQRRALTIARNLAQFNAGAIREGQLTGTSVNIATREIGVDTALIISSSDGSIIAPAHRAATYPDIPFIHEARRLGQESVQQIDSSTIGALVPIDTFSPETGARTVTAHAVVIYNMGSLAVDDKQTISLFIQTFFIALIVGAILFYFLYKLIEYPLQSLNQQLSVALRERRDDLSVDYQFPALQDLISNVNSLLNRALFGSADESSHQVIEKDRSLELQNTVELIGYPAMGINVESQSVTHINAAFEEKTGQSLSHLAHMPLTHITDQALQLSLRDLVDKVLTSPDEMVSNELEIGGENHQIMALGISGNQHIAYILIVLIPKMGEV